MIPYRLNWKSCGGAALAALVATRIPILLFGLIATKGDLHRMLARWDTGFYASIALEGYSWDPSITTRGQNIVFFPLYPFLMRILAPLAGGDVVLAGLMLSLACFTVAVALLYRLAALEIGDTGAGAAVLFLVTYPFSLFFSASYTESLFLLVTVGAFYAMRRERPLEAALFGLAAGLARPNGFWIAAPLLWLGLEWTKSKEKDGGTAVRWAAIAVGLCPLVGAALYSGYLHVAFGDALAWIRGQAAWGLPLVHQTAFRAATSSPEPVQLAAAAASPLLSSATEAVEVVVTTANLVAFLFAIATFIPVSRRLGLAYGMLIPLYLGPPFVAHLVTSMGRFSSVIFPMFFWMATTVPRCRVVPLAVAFGVLQAMLAVLFYLGQPVF
jgi:hypothetical protein